VWSKEGSGKVDVRKLLIWKTNKESAGYSAYVVHWTDYSSTRKSPIDREVRLAPSEKEAVKIAEAMIAENIKKGWSVGIVLETKRVESLASWVIFSPSYIFPRDSALTGHIPKTS
jgi:hypothetical protein